MKDAFGQNDLSDNGENCPSLSVTSVIIVGLGDAEKIPPAVLLLLADLMAAFDRTGVAEVTRDGVTYRLKDLQDLGDDGFYFRIEIEPRKRQ